MTDPQDALITAVTAALAEHAGLTGTWVFAYEDISDADGEFDIDVTVVADGSPTAMIGVAAVARERMMDRFGADDA